MQGFDIKAVEGKERTKGEHNPPSGRHNPKNRNVISDVETIKIMEEVERLLSKGENLECINLLRALKDNMQGVKSNNLQVLVIVNLGILYYQVGFLEEAQEQLALATSRLRELSQKALGFRSKDVLRIKYETILGKLELQLCILFSQMGKHEQALEHARTSSKISYNLVYDILARLYSSLNKLLVAKGYPKQEKQPISIQDGAAGLNHIAILTHLLNSTKDLKLAFLQKERSTLLEEQTQITRKYGFVSPKVDLDALYPPDDKVNHLWVYKNKILDEIQLVPFDLAELQQLEPEVTNTEVIEKITYLAISLYCYSTETRFIEKQKNCDSHDVLDSEHWLSRSLEIAYSFMPVEAPILNQIITVHDRFHGLDKQTIPEDQEVTGFFKVLKPLSKPKSTYSSKNPGCSPIMIRIQADKVDLQMDATAKTHRERPSKSNHIELDQNRTLDLDSLTKNNRIRNYSHGHKRMETTDAPLGRPSLSSRTTIDIPQINQNHPNVRTNYANKKFSKKKEDKLKVNFSQLNGKALISEDLLARPRSIEDAKTTVHEGHLRALTDRKKRSLPSRKTEPQKKGNQIKFEGLELKGHRMEESDGDFFERVSNEPRVEATATRMGGNVYINNNINLFISKNNEPFSQTFVRGQVAEKEGGSRRQMFLNKRRANNFMAHEHLD